MEDPVWEKVTCPLLIYFGLCSNDIRCFKYKIDLREACKYLVHNEVISYFCKDNLHNVDKL